MIEIRIAERAIKYGYIYWTKKDDDKVTAEFDAVKEAEVLVNGISLGVKKIDYRYRRISIGVRIAGAFKSGSYFRISKKNSKLIVDV
ncbi:hypothetical protein [Pseudemcibacter aquimaris]|uniref:hypothetical protein n=1 Tax=Pseudemcibacter aquimaris TaxID=2857064 RepID=UPI0020137EC7|nr:hypothetical protein [Pseudemcibacter aquimaris]MCC3862529.1 hypothetical protein [Pseudemcibacter aquimaris]WDU57792.1 hypothetical protein KW060_11350 [Pseudemcibacter aquimaris]